MIGEQITTIFYSYYNYIMPNQASATNTSARTTRNTKARNTRNISARKTTRNNLPINLRVNIVKQLTVQDRLRMGQVSKNNHSLIHKNSKLLQAIRAIIRPTNNRPTNNLNANRAQKIINHVNTLTNTNKHNQILTSFTSLKDPMGSGDLRMFTTLTQFRYETGVSRMLI